MKSTESDVCYFEVDAVFNREPVELLEESTRLFKIAAAAILDFQKFEILTVYPVPGANVRHRAAKFHQDRSNGCR